MPCLETVEVSTEWPEGPEETLNPVRSREKKKSHALRAEVSYSDPRLQGRVKGATIKRSGCAEQQRYVNFPLAMDWKQLQEQRRRAAPLPVRAVA